MGYTIWPDGPTGEAVEAVYRERGRQEDLCAAGKFPHTCASRDGLTNPQKLAVLAEEFGEVAKHVTEEVISADRLNREKLRAELIQVAAVAVAWSEALS